MALCAVLCEDERLESSAGLEPSLRERILEAIDALQSSGSGTGRHRLAKEMTTLLRRATLDDIRRSWPEAPPEISPFAGLERLLQVSALPDWPSPGLPEPWDRLADARFGERLGLLSMDLIRLATEGTRWAVEIVSKGTGTVTRACDVNPRLAPAIAWVAIAIEDESDLIESLLSTLPRSFSRGLAAVLEARSNRLDNSTGGATDSLVRRTLEERLRAHG